MIHFIFYQSNNYRIDSCYAALIASGSWKAHEHKALAKEARKAWDDLLASKGDKRLWLRHVKGHP